MRHANLGADESTKVAVVKEETPAQPPLTSPKTSRSSKLWKHSLARMKEGHTGEESTSTPHFQAALRRDASNEIHPGWRSIQRLGRVVG